MDDSQIDKYARDCHQLIVVDKGLVRECQSMEELVCARLVASLEHVAELQGLFEDWRDTAQQQSKRAEAAEARVQKLEHQLDELQRRELKANPAWVQLRTLSSGAVCDGQCGGEACEQCGTCKADAAWSDRVAGLEVVDIVFDGPPGPVAGRFVEVEDQARCSIRLGEWVHRNDGLWVLRLTVQRKTVISDG